MAEWTTIAIPMGGGLDVKTDAKVVLPTKLTALENAEFVEGGSVRKRPGYDRVTAPANALGLATRKDELLCLTTTGIHSYDAHTGAFQDAGEYCPMTWVAEPVVNSTSAQTRGDCATNSGVTAYAWQDSRGGVRYALYDSVTGAAFLADGSLSSANASEPKVVASGENLVIAYRDTANNDLKYKLIRPGDITGSIASAVGDLTTTLSANSDYDIVGGDTASFWVLYEDSSGGVDLTLKRFSSSCALLVTAVVTANDVERPLALAYNGATGKLLVAYATTASGDTTVAEYTGSSLAPTGVTTTITQANTLEGISLAALDDGGISCYTTSATGGANTTSWYYRNASGTETSGTILKGHTYSSGWNAGSIGYHILSFDSITSLQDSYFVFRHDGVLVGRLFYGEGNGNPRTSSASYGPRVSALGDGTFQCVLEYRTGLPTDSGANKDVIKPDAAFTGVGLRRVVFDPGPTPSSVDLEGTAYLSGSMLWAYDGGPHPVEANPLQWPDWAPGVANGGTLASSARAGSIPIGSLNYRVYAEFTLANGQRVRSAAITRLLTTASSNEVDMTIPSIPFTRWLSDRPNLRFVVYRTEVNKSDLYYRVSSSDPSSTGDNAHCANDPATATVAFTDNMTDAVLITQELDYQCQGELPHLAPDGTSFAAAAQARLFLVGGGTKPNNIAPSLLRFDGEPVHFNPNQVISETPTYGGAVTGVAPLNDVVVAFKERAVFAVAGNGPDNTNSSGFFETRALSSDMGCTDPGTIVSLPIGVMFKSRKGFHLITPDFQIAYVGADVEAYNTQTFVGAAPVPDSNQVVFVSADGPALVFDWYYRSWAVWTNHTGLDACVWKEDTFAYLRDDGYVFLRNSGVYTDGGTGYALKIRTAPIRPENSVQRQWLVGPVTVLGDYRSLHRLLVDVIYDRDESAFERFTVTPANFVNTELYGDDTPYGDADYYGGDIASGEYQFEFKPKRSKCQTVRFEFTDIPGTNPGASYEITELAMRVGLIGGNARLPATRKV